MKQVLPHIQIGLYNEEHVIVVVGDYELADFIDDYLCEDCDLPSDYRTIAERPGGEIITLHFPACARLQEVDSCLTRLSSDEIERIYRLNNELST
ncbi:MULTISPECIES: hypothetical protein [Duganella]|uniref:hypothetical protein n=1 Tax=Duganella TaxID=75654 RepID=UPI00159E2C73